MQGYVIFDCGMNQMKTDLKSVWPECASSYSFRSFTKNVMTQSHIQILQPIINAFVNLEAGYPTIQPEDSAKKNIPTYFKFMYACLTRCRNFRYSNFLTKKGLTQAQSLRQLVLELNGLTENDSEAAKDAAFLEFALSYAKLRHACNGYHHTYTTELQYSYNASLPEIMYSMGLLSVWNFHAEDIRYINGIRSTFFPLKSKILTSPYNFEVINNVGQKTIISGFLPHIDIKYCPRLPISWKFNR